MTKRALKFFAKLGVLLLVLNEVRGFILAAPVFYALWHSGGTLMAWLAFCSLAGIALSVIVPLIAARWVKRHSASMQNHRASLSAKVMFAPDAWKNVNSK
jgi:hypothetical protein